MRPDRLRLRTMPWLSPRRIARAGEPVVDLLLHDVRHVGMLVGEDDEVLGRHDQDQHRLDGDDGGRTGAAGRAAAFADDVARASFGDDLLPAVFVNEDLCPAIEDDHHILGWFAFGHEYGTGPKRPLLRCRYQVPLLGRRKVSPEVRRAGISRADIANRAQETQHLGCIEFRDSLAPLLSLAMHQVEDVPVASRIPGCHHAHSGSPSRASGTTPRRYFLALLIWLPTVLTRIPSISAISPYS